VILEEPRPERPTTLDWFLVRGSESEGCFFLHFMPVFPSQFNHRLLHQTTLSAVPVLTFEIVNRAVVYKTTPVLDRDWWEDKNTVSRKSVSQLISCNERLAACKYSQPGTCNPLIELWYFVRFWTFQAACCESVGSKECPTI